MDFKALSKTATDELYEQYPHADWDYAALSSNAKISEEIITKYAWHPWDYIKISMREDINDRLDKYNCKIRAELKQKQKRKKKKDNVPFLQENEECEYN